MERVDIILEYLDELFPNPKCELNYTLDYELLIAVVLSAQTTDKRVNMVTPILFERYKTLEDLAQACIDDVAMIIKPIGTFRKKAEFIIGIAKYLTLHSNGRVPNDREFLSQLPGVGRKTCNVVLSNLYDVPAIAVDTHVARVSKRLGFARLDDEVNVIEQKLMRKIPRNRWTKFHHQMVLFGRYYCKAKSPLCENCKLKDLCHEVSVKVKQ